MNIDDVEEIGDIPQGSNIFMEIFEKQHKLESKYSKIEMENGFYYPPNGKNQIPNLDDPQTQNWVKNMLWRVTEELAEAMEEYPKYDRDEHWKDKWDERAEVRHHFEEIADALHFFVATSLILGIKPSVVGDQWDNIKLIERAIGPVMPSEDLISMRMFYLVKAMGLVANCFKNKPWKNTHMPTDVDKLRKNMMYAWLEFHTLWKTLKCDTSDIYTLYSKKNAVNVFRQRSNY